MADTNSATPPASAPPVRTLSTVAKAESVVDAIALKIWGLLKSATYWATLLTGAQHVLSAVYISLRDWHVALFWLVVVVSTYWVASWQTERDWAPLSRQNAALEKQVGELKHQVVVTKAALVCPICPAIPVCPQAVEAPPAAPPSAPAVAPARHKKAPTGLLGGIKLPF